MVKSSWIIKWLDYLNGDQLFSCPVSNRNRMDDLITRLIKVCYFDVPITQMFAIQIPTVNRVISIMNFILQISTRGICKPAPKFSSTFLPPGFFRRVKLQTLKEEFVRVEDGLALPSVQTAIVSYLGQNYPQRPRTRKSGKPKKLYFDFSNVKKLY